MEIELFHKLNDAGQIPCDFDMLHVLDYKRSSFFSKEIAIAGFKTFDDARLFAKKNNLFTVTLFKQDGSNFWEIDRYADEPIDLLGDYPFFNDNTIYYSKDSLERLLQDFKEYIDSFDEPLEHRELMEIIDKYIDMCSLLLKMKKDEVLVDKERCSNSYSVYKIYNMEFYDDGKTYIIAVM